MTLISKRYQYQYLAFNLTENMLSLFGTLSTNKKHAVLSNFKSKKYSVLGGASSKVLKSCVEQIAQSLTDIVNCSLSQGIIPEDDKRPITKPLLKKFQTNIYRVFVNSRRLFQGLLVGIK